MMMSGAVEHHLRIKALAAGLRNPFCVSCGGHRERFGASVCRDCAGWANRAVLRVSRRRLRATFSIIDGGLEAKS